ncbi:MAG: hypothetical protein P8174_06870 [Gemmatimonadota bacterium]
MGKGLGDPALTLEPVGGNVPITVELAGLAALAAGFRATGSPLVRVHADSGYLDRPSRPGRRSWPL